jgi:hypothetical protein
VAAATGFPGDPIAGGALSWVNWVAGVVTVYATLFGVGSLIFGDLTKAIVYLVVAAIAFALIARNLRSESYVRGLTLGVPAVGGEVIH